MYKASRSYEIELFIVLVWNKAIIYCACFLCEFGPACVLFCIALPVSCLCSTRMPGRHLAFSIFSLEFIIYSPGVPQKPGVTLDKTLLKSHVLLTPRLRSLLISSLHLCCTCLISSDVIPGVQCSPHRGPTPHCSSTNNLAYELCAN